MLPSASSAMAREKRDSWIAEFGALLRFGDDGALVGSDFERQALDVAAMRKNVPNLYIESLALLR